MAQRLKITYIAMENYYSLTKTYICKECCPLLELNNDLYEYNSHTS